ncbi:MAG: hypothetical protein ACOYMG_04100 [Candidatus Methylumidiphilus sp.]
MLNAVSTTVTELPQRLIFGYPHAVQFSGGGNVHLKRTVHPSPTDMRKEDEKWI